MLNIMIVVISGAAQKFCKSEVFVIIQDLGKFLCSLAQFSIIWWELMVCWTWDNET